MRKTVVGTVMYPMWGEYPGLCKRLEELGVLLDEMAATAQRQYPGGGLDLAVFPEYSTSGGLPVEASKLAFPLEGPILDRMGAKAREHNCYVVLSTFVPDDEVGDRYWHLGLLLDRQGQVAGVYRKVHPVLTGENVLEGGVTPGGSFPVFECDFGRVGILICIDLSYDDSWEGMRKGRAELVAWPTMSPGQIKAAVRAVQNDCYIVSSTWRNNASLIDPTGHMVREVREPRAVLVQEIDLDYVILPWQPELRNGLAFDDAYGDRAGYRYSEAEDAGIFWSNDPGTPVLQMVRELGLDLFHEKLEKNRTVQDRMRGGPTSVE